MGKVVRISAVLMLEIIVGVSLGLLLLVVTAPASSEPKPFSHQQCQYPERTTNLPHGCDNSDPCDPLSAVKGGSGECDE